MSDKAESLTSRKEAGGPAVDEGNILDLKVIGLSHLKVTPINTTRKDEGKLTGCRLDVNKPVSYSYT